MGRGLFHGGNAPGPSLTHPPGEGGFGGSVRIVGTQNNGNNEPGATILDIENAPLHLVNTVNITSISVRVGF